MKQGLISNADKQYLNQIKSAESKVMEQAKEVLTSNGEEKSYKPELKRFTDLLDTYYEIIISIKHTCAYRTDSLYRMLEFMISFPVRSRINNKWTSYVYDRTDLLNNLTFLIFQMSTLGINEQILGEFLEYIDGSSLAIITKLYFYRINPIFIDEYGKTDRNVKTEKDVLSLLPKNAPFGRMDIDRMTPKELYYSIATGYFGSNNGIKEAEQKLYELCKNSPQARYFLRRLKDEGFHVAL